MSPPFSGMRDSLSNAASMNKTMIELQTVKKSCCCHVNLFNFLLFNLCWLFSLFLCLQNIDFSCKTIPNAIFNRLIGYLSLCLHCKMIKFRTSIVRQANANVPFLARVSHRHAKLRTRANCISNQHLIHSFPGWKRITSIICASNGKKNMLALCQFIKFRAF